VKKMHPCAWNCVALQKDFDQKFSFSISKEEQHRHRWTESDVSNLSAVVVLFCFIYCYSKMLFVSIRSEEESDDGFFNVKALQAQLDADEGGNDG